MKRKTLKKKIRRLEARLRAGAKKLNKLKGKLGAITRAGAGKKKKKSATRARKAGKTAKAVTPIQKKRRRAKAKPAVIPPAAKKPSVAKKVKGKPGFSPERRAQLAAAMKARWTAKRAADEASPQNISTDRDFALRPVPQSL
jgi:hypothetical protein